MRRQLRKNFLQAGFSLVEVIVAMGILTLVALGSVQLLSSVSKSQKVAQSKDQQFEISMTIREILSTKEGCFNTFKNLVFDPATQLPNTELLSQIVDGSGEAIYKVGDADTSKLVAITKLKVSKYTPAFNTPYNSMISLEIGLKKYSNSERSSRAQGGHPTQNQNITNDFKSDVLTLKTKINETTNKIDECLIIDAKLDKNDYWKESSVNPNNIYYNENVVVGVGDPKAALTVYGEMKLASTNLNKPCNNNETYGQQRYNSLTKNMEWCDGLAWKPYAIDKPKACMGFFWPCLNGKKTYVIIQNRDPDAPNTPEYNCPYSAGDEDSSACGGPGNPAPACIGDWGPCINYQQTYTITQQGTNPPCSVAANTTRYCGNKPAIGSCSDSTWFFTGTQCEKDATAGNFTPRCPVEGETLPGGYFAYDGFMIRTATTCGGTNNGPVTCKCSGSGGSHTPGGPITHCRHAQQEDFTYPDDVPGYCVGSYSCASVGGTLSGSKCVKPAIYTCPATHPINNGDGTCSAN